MVASKDMDPFPKNFSKIFWNNQFKVTIELPNPKRLPSLKGKVAIVTGANTGLGFEASKQLLSLSLSRLVIAVRSLEKGKAAASKFLAEYPAANIDIWALDMESYHSIQAFVRKCDTELPRIDYTILNAGLGPIVFETVLSTGHEKAIQVNHISTSLLLVLLLPILKAKASQDNPPRVTVVNSVTAHLCKFPNHIQRPLLQSFDDINITPWDPSERYGVSKLLSQLFLVKLTDHVASDSVIINMVDPGLTKGTELGRNATGMLRFGSKLFFSICGRPRNRGAATYIDALLGHGKETHGCFLMNTEISPYVYAGNHSFYLKLSTFYYSAEGKTAQEQIWKETLQVLSFANVKEIIASMK